MKPVHLSHIASLGQSSEVLLRKEPPALRILIWSIFLLLVAIFTLIVFGKMDDVVKATGVIRPETNISLVRNVVSGEIQEILYRPGQKVSTGDTLLKIKPDLLLAQKHSLEAQLADQKVKVSGLDSIVQSYYANRNCVPPENPAAFTRFDSWFAEKKQLEDKAAMARLLWKEEESLPNSGTTAVTIRNLKYESQLADTDLEKQKIQFLATLSSEKDALLLQSKTLENQLAQTNTNLDSTILHSPVDGYVQEISSLNQGDYLFSDQEVLKIVPANDRSFRVELKIPAKDAGKLKKGMKVKLRFPAFPYYEFRGATGMIKNIDPDAVANSSGILYFTVLTDIDRTSLFDKKKIEYPLRVGLETDARIVLERQTILYFILKKMDFLL